MKGDRGLYYDPDFRGVHNRAEVKAKRKEKMVNKKYMRRMIKEDMKKEISSE